MTKAKQEIFLNNPEAAKESRCFFCYGTFEDDEVIIRMDDVKIYHNQCLKDMLVANEIEVIELIKIDNSIERFEGFKLNHPYPKSG